MNGTWRELGQELREVLGERGGLVDAALPPLVFVAVNALWSLNGAIWITLLAAALLAAFRLIRGQSLKYALGGLGAALVAMLSARLLNSASAYFVPGLITALLTVLVCGVSAIVRRPLVAWTSHLVRRWPLGWYWHPKVRPAYTEVTVAWAVFFALKLVVQLLLLQEAQASALAIIQVMMGWPATIVLLVLSYLYGQWRLKQLHGPSVSEFKAHAEPPWTGQRRGF